MRRRPLSVAVLLLVLGAVVVLLANGQTWGRVSYLGSTPPRREVATGSQLVPGLHALALVALAAAAALLATKDRLRRLVAGITLLLGVGTVYLSVHGATDDTLLDQCAVEGGGTAIPGHPGFTSELLHYFGKTFDHTAWPIVAAVGGGLIVLAAIAGWAAAGAGGLSAKYESPSTPAPAPAAVSPDFADVATWQALDRDEDPTGG